MTRDLTFEEEMQIFSTDQGDKPWLKPNVIPRFTGG
jgi:hypothetical protein